MSVVVAMGVGLVAAVSGTPPDWLVTRVQTPAAVVPRPEENRLVLENGLVRRSFRTAPNAATIDLESLSTGVSVLRGVKPEAVLDLDGRRFAVGGLKGQPDYAYLDPAWLDALTSDPDAFQFACFRTDAPEERYPWKPKRHAAETLWPPKGIGLVLDFVPPASLSSRYAGLVVSVHYELYEGLPVLCKWVTVRNGTPNVVDIGALETEILAVTEQEKHRLHVESDYAFNTMNTTQ